MKYLHIFLFSFLFSYSQSTFINYKHDFSDSDKKTINDLKSKIEYLKNNVNEKKSILKIIGEDKIKSALEKERLNKKLNNGKVVSIYYTIPINFKLN